MKSKEEILKKNWDANPKNFPFIGIYEGNTDAIMKAMQEYATEAIKADRERVANMKVYSDPPHSFVTVIFSETEKKAILNLPIELP